MVCVCVCVLSTFTILHPMIYLGFCLFSPMTCLGFSKVCYVLHLGQIELRVKKLIHLNRLYIMLRFNSDSHEGAVNKNKGESWTLLYLCDDHQKHCQTKNTFVSDFYLRDQTG